MDGQNNKDTKIHVYGPVPSRRLGYSLGVDILPPKTCTLDCIYCQLGRTPKTTVQRKTYYDQEDIITQIEEVLSSEKRIDVITFSGSGEPTLNKNLRKLIRDIKKITHIPVAVLTNATLLTDDRVRRDLLEADIVVPSLDAVTQNLFVKVNRPHASQKIDKIIRGLKVFRREFSGQIWLEIMLIRGINDSPDHIQKLKKIIAQISPNKIQLNTVIRPPAEEEAQPLTPAEMEKIRSVLGEDCEVIADFSESEQPPHATSLESAILTTVQRRPVTLSDMAAFLGKHPDEILKYLNKLMQKNQIKRVQHEGKTYFEPTETP
jgi:wyosine [tRNA(Phe)-imidazoG37] synthetase (radical SAM superfamily)